MDINKFIDFMSKIEKLKCNTRHSWTSSGRRESVAEHSWRLTVMAYLTRDEFPEIDNEKLIKMCLIHDFGEAVIGDIPSFYKTENDEEREALAVRELVRDLPNADELVSLFEEMEKMETPEAKLWRALDKLEAVISHNEADISTWIPLEYTENLVYGEEEASRFEWTKALKAQLRENSLKKIEESKK